MNIIIVSHYTRSAWAAQIARALPGAVVLTDFMDCGALEAHRNALRTASRLGGRSIIMEDDAIPVEGFIERATAWIEHMPDDLISFYLGTSRPKNWQPRIEHRLREPRGDAPFQYIQLGSLVHAVCYTLPEQHIPRVLEGMCRREADYAIGAAWGNPVIYPVESLVEHRDEGCVERHPDGEPRTQKRVARRLAGQLMYERASQ